MDKSMILEIMYNGNRYMEKIKMYDNENYNKYYGEFNELCNKLVKNLSDEDRKTILYDMDDAQNCMQGITADEYFKEGFKLGLIIGAQNFLK